MKLEITPETRRAVERTYCRLLREIHGGSWSIVRPDEAAPPATKEAPPHGS